ncbi:hypothetical protein CDL15_Pgr000938 [Punica granatum]|uniref:Uncharacterized protein n=1 Tax=Punica granatum TaxID=22663 RepID=A0A218XI62_PUNGR|nr:hypothetical protein CDL15_Pgr000938 [Punica granatum]
MQVKSFSLNPMEMKHDDLVDDWSVKGTKSLADKYQRCNIAVLEPAGYGEAKADQRRI